MNRFKAALLALALLAAAGPGGARALTLAWTGGGGTAAASEGRNWTAGRPPADGDRVIFGLPSSRDCVWDLSVDLAALTISENFRGDIALSAPLRVAGDLVVRGGMIDLRRHSAAVGGRVYVGGRGILEMSEGTLAVGPGGVLVDGGAFFSRSPGRGGAAIKSLHPGAHYPFAVSAGRLLFSNPAGTVIDGSSGVTFYSVAEIRRADFVEIRNLQPGGTALRIFRPRDYWPELKSWTFDASVRRKTAVGDLALERDELAALALAAYRAAPLEPAGESAEAPAAGPAPESGEPFAAAAAYKAGRDSAAVVPYLALQLSGGQYFVGREKGGLSGNLNLLASAAVKHERLGGWTLVPVLSSQYQGTKQVTDLVGGGTLFQERMSHGLSLRGAYRLAPRLTIKPSVGYRREFLKETRDESWGGGLFDYARPGFSVEAEYAYADPFTLRAAYDFYLIDFVNYASLESVIKDSAGSALARELAGRDVLDFYNHALSAGGTLQGPWRTFLEGGLTSTLRLFPDQRVVREDGELTGAARRDLASQLSAAWRAPRQLSAGWKAVAGLRFSLGHNYSTQNSYDAQRTKFLRNYYDTLSLRGGLDLDLHRRLPGADRPLSFNLSFTAGRIGYNGRQAQAPSGLYLGDKIRQNEALLSAGLSYPVAPHFVWTCHFGYGRQTSNQRFERLYKYNFKTTTYRFGFGYEF